MKINSEKPRIQSEMRIKIFNGKGQMTFGTYKGELIDNIDDVGYLEWVLKSVPFEKRSKALIEKRLAELKKVESDATF